MRQGCFPSYNKSRGLFEWRLLFVEAFYRLFALVQSSLVGFDFPRLDRLETRALGGSLTSKLQGVQLNTGLYKELLQHYAGLALHKLAMLSYKELVTSNHLPAGESKPYFYSAR